MAFNSAGAMARNGGNSDRRAAPVRLISASFRKYSGRAGRLLVNCATNSSLLLICKRVVGQRSVPIVDERSARMFFPQSDPAPCAGYTSTLSASVSNLSCRLS